MLQSSGNPFRQIELNRKNLSNTMPSFIVGRTVSTQIHEQRPQIGDEAAFSAGIEGNSDHYSRNKQNEYIDHKSLNHC